MKNFFATAVLIFLVSCSQKKPASIGETAFQIKMNKDFKDASKSPLKAKDLKTFEYLDFFKFDDAYIVDAKLKLTPQNDWFKLKRSDNTHSLERIYGVLSFKLKGKAFQLNVYQGQEKGFGKKKLSKLLFLPFLDDTNGSSTYGGGRYIDLKYPVGDTLQIDFNKAYNPYCAYNEKYSCPIVPRENYLAFKVEAGVKAFKK